MTEEIPRKVVLVILIIAIVLSLLGTWVTLDALSSKNEVYYIQPTDAGKIGFTVIENIPNNQNAGAANG